MVGFMMISDNIAETTGKMPLLFFDFQLLVDLFRARLDAYQASKLFILIRA